MASASASPELAGYLPRLIAEVGDADDPVVVDGTLLYADLSGFTRLAERLKVEGREGAELLTTIVNGAFETVLDPSLGLGGDVVSFGGDSASILFSEGDHAGRAVTAAAAMQRALAGREGIDTGAGRVRLRMSIGLASGPVTLVPTGNEQRVALMIGPTVDAAIDLESRADANRVWASAEVVASVPDAPWRAADDAGSELAWRRVPTDNITRAERSTGGSTIGPAELERWLAPALRSELGGEPAGGELRRTVVGFVRAAPLATHPSPVDVARAVATAVEAATHRWGVCWLATDICAGGLSFVLTAGSPTTNEDDVERMHRAMASIVEDAPLGAVRAGIELGVVFAGDLGHPARRCWTVMGDCVNVAARLAAAAPAGQVHSGPSVTAESRNARTATSVGRQEVRGRRVPIEVFRVAPASPNQARIGPLRPTAFIGRDREIGELDRRWVDARAGRGGTIDVVGEAGIGKTRLLAEFRRGVVDAGDDHPPVTEVRADEFHATVPFATAAKLLRSALGIDADAPPTVAGVLVEQQVAERAPHLAPWLPLLADAALAKVAMTDAVRRLDARFVADRRAAVVTELLETVQRGPWLVVVDDLQWIDASSRDLVRAIAQVAPRSEWLVCLSRRSTADPLIADLDALELRWLGPTQAAELAAAAADPTPLTDEQIQRVVDAAAGNPLFLEQLAIRATIDDEELPDTVERLIAARIDTLEPASRRRLREVSVVGATAPLDVVARLLDDADLNVPERWEAMQGFIELAGLVLRFRSGLIRSVAHDGLPFARRRELHRAMATIIQSTGVVEDFDDLTLGQLAWHLSEASDASSAWPVVLEAAGRARARGALVEAADLYDRALALPRRSLGQAPAAIAAAYESLAEVCLDLGRLDRSLESWAAAARLVDDPVERARVCSKRSGVELLRGEYGKALRWGTRGFRLVEDLPESPARVQRIRLLVDQAATRFYQGRLRDSLRLAEDALAETTGIDDRGLLGRVHQHLEMAHSALGDGHAVAHGEVAVAHFEAVDDQRSLASVLANMGVTASAEGRWDDAAEHYQGAAAATVATGNTTVAAVVTVNRASLFLRQGEVDRAEPLALDAGRVLEASGHEVFVGYTEHLRSTIALWRRDHPGAVALLADARARFAAHDAGQFLLGCDVSEVEAILHAGDAERAAARASEATATVDDAGDAEALPVQVRRLWALAELRRGDIDAAVALAEDAVARGRALETPFELALALDALAHAQTGSGVPADPALLAERDELLAGLGVRRTLFPLAR